MNCESKEICIRKIIEQAMGAVAVVYRTQDFLSWAWYCVACPLPGLHHHWSQSCFITCVPGLIVLCPAALRIASCLYKHIPSFSKPSNNSPLYSNTQILMVASRPCFFLCFAQAGSHLFLCVHVDCCLSAKFLLSLSLHSSEPWCDWHSASSPWAFLISPSRCADVFHLVTYSTAYLCEMFIVNWAETFLFPDASRGLTIVPAMRWRPGKSSDEWRSHSNWKALQGNQMPTQLKEKHVARFLHVNPRSLFLAPKGLDRRF